MAKDSSNKEFAMRVVKIGLALVGATVLGTWATRRAGWAPVYRGAVRAIGAGLAAYLVRKKAPNAAIGLGTYAVATLAAGAVEQYDMSRYLAATDAQRAQLGQGSSSGAQTQGGTTQGATQQLNAAAGPGFAGDAMRQYQQAGYVTF